MLLFPQDPQPNVLVCVNPLKKLPPALVAAGIQGLAFALVADGEDGAGDVVHIPQPLDRRVGKHLAFDLRRQDGLPEAGCDDAAVLSVVPLAGPWKDKAVPGALRRRA